MVNAGLIAQRRDPLPRGATEYELTAAGEELLFVAGVLERWLEECPSASRPFGGEGAKAAIGALAEGWSATLLRALAAKPLSVAELDSLIGGFNYPSLERRIAAMRLAGQVEALPANGRETPYAVTAWLRRAIAPLLAAIRWERRHLADDRVPVAGIDVEAILLLAMPLLDPEGELPGSCRLAVEFRNGRDPRLFGVLSKFEDGALVSCSSRLDGDAGAWISGSVSAWLQALIDHETASLELGGDGGLARAVVGGLHKALFAPTALEDLGKPALERR